MTMTIIIGVEKLMNRWSYDILKYKYIWTVFAFQLHTFNGLGLNKGEKVWYRVILYFFYVLQTFFPGKVQVIFCCFFTQDVFGDLLWWEEEGRRQAVDHLGADLIWDLVLETVLLRTSNCISSVFLLYFFSIPASLYQGLYCTTVHCCLFRTVLLRAY